MNNIRIAIFIMLSKDDYICEFTYEMYVGLLGSYHENEYINIHERDASYTHPKGYSRSVSDK